MISQRRERPVIFHYGSTAGSAPGRDRFPSSYSIMVAATSSAISTPTTTSAERSHVAGCCVIAVDYRLAPEHKFPAAVEDAAAALHWIVQEAQNLSIDPSCVAVGGDSAGGNLSANMAHLSRDGEVPQLCFQMLLYPGTDMSMSQPSYQRDFTRFPLSIEAIEYFIGHYLRDSSDYTDPRAAPLLAANFKQLAPAFVLTAGCDPLADEGMAYARKLEDNGVPVTLVHMSDQMHGFLTMGRVIRASEFALEMAGMALARAFNSKQTAAPT